MANGCLAFACFAAIGPDIAGSVPLGEGSLSFSTSASPIVVVMFVGGGLAFAGLHVSQTRGRARPQETARKVDIGKAGKIATVQGDGNARVGDNIGGDKIDVGGAFYDHSPVYIEQHYHTTLAAPGSPTIPNEIPSSPVTFTGRDEQLDQLACSMRTEGVLISGLCGMGGIGKTALALKLAEKLERDYPQGRVFVDLRGADPKQRAPLTVAEAMTHVIRAFDRTASMPDDEDQLVGLYRTQLSEKRALLVLDNAQNAEQVRKLLPPSPCGAIVTSRRQFQVLGVELLELSRLDRPKSCELLTKLYRRDGELADELADLCGDLPLALELAGSALSGRTDLSPADYIERLRDHANRLGRLGQHADEADLLPISASLELSESLLPETLRPLFCALSVFPLSFDAAAAAAVWDAEKDHAGDRLHVLRSYSLVEFDKTTKRYRLHDLVRLFARGKAS